MTGKWNPDEVPSVSCGVLRDRVYQFLQWHCHWARNNHNGSEHTFNERAYPMECHFVHYRKDYGSFQEAALREDGLLVIAYVYDVSILVGSKLGIRNVRVWIKCEIRTRNELYVSKLLRRTCPILKIRPL